MPAASWPRCWSACSPNATSVAASTWPRRRRRRIPPADDHRPGDSWSASSCLSKERRGCARDGDRRVRCRACFYTQPCSRARGLRHLLRVLSLLDQPVELVLVVRAVDPATLALRLGRAARLAQGADGAGGLFDLRGARPGVPHGGRRPVAVGGRYQRAQPIGAGLEERQGPCVDHPAGLLLVFGRQSPGEREIAETDQHHAARQAENEAKRAIDRRKEALLDAPRQTRSDERQQDENG